MQQSRTAVEVVGNLGAWEKRWKWTPTSVHGSGTSVAQPDNSALQQELDSVKSQLEKQQQTVDRAISRGTMQPQAKKQKGDGGGDGTRRPQGGGGKNWNNNGGGNGGNKPWLQSRKKGKGNRG